MKKLIPMYVKMQSMLKDEKGATMVEYALMVALIAVVCIGAVTLIGTSAETKFNEVQSAITGAAPAPAP